MAMIVSKQPLSPLKIVSFLFMSVTKECNDIVKYYQNGISTEGKVSVPNK